MEGSPVKLSVDSLSLSFGGVKALTDVSFQLHDREILAVIGPNGAGKTALLNCINGFYKPQRGQIKFNGQEITRVRPDKIARSGIARTFQNIELAYNYASSAREIMDKAGVKPGDVRTITDLEKLPITRKTELIERQKKMPPYGGFLTIAPEDVERVYISPGPIYEPLANSKIKWFAKSFWAAGFRKGDIVINSFTYHLSPAGILFHEAIRDCGATPVPTGVGNTEIQIQTLRDMKVTGFVGTPSFLMTVIKRAEELGLDVRKDFALKRAWFTGEMLPPSIRHILEEDYHIATAQAYAVTELGGAIAYECRFKTGLHLMDEYITEIVNPQTGKQLPEGEPGEIVVTPVLNPTWTLVRYGTGDLSAYITEKCPCGRTALRLTGIIGRTSDAVKVRGMFIVAKQAEQVVAGFSQIARFQIEVGRLEQRDVMTLKVELKDGGIDRKALSGELDKRFQDNLRVRADEIVFVPPGTIPENRKTITDTRKWD